VIRLERDRGKAVRGKQRQRTWTGPEETAPSFSTNINPRSDSPRFVTAARARPLTIRVGDGGTLKRAWGTLSGEFQGRCDTLEWNVQNGARIRTPRVPTQIEWMAESSPHNCAMCLSRRSKYSMAVVALRADADNATGEDYLGAFAFVFSLPQVHFTIHEAQRSVTSQHSFDLRQNSFARSDSVHSRRINCFLVSSSDIRLSVFTRNSHPFPRSPAFITFDDTPGPLRDFRLSRPSATINPIPFTDTF
jgi:hypothetical protein